MIAQAAKAMRPNSVESDLYIDRLNLEHGPEVTLAGKLEYLWQLLLWPVTDKRGGKEERKGNGKLGAMCNLFPFGTFCQTSTRMLCTAWSSYNNDT